MKLIVLNLPHELEESELEELFKVHGKITAFNLVSDDETGTSKGFGFVEMEREEDAMAAIEKLHGTKIQKRKIRVKPAK